MVKAIDPSGIPPHKNPIPAAAIHGDFLVSSVISGKSLVTDAYSKDKKNPDILNYLGFTSRKSGNFTEAEDYYLKGLSINPKHNGINEYLGELYVQTNRIDKANERLEVLKTCNCKEYQELELIIKTRGTKIY